MCCASCWVNCGRVWSQDVSYAFCSSSILLILVYGYGETEFLLSGLFFCTLLHFSMENLPPEVNKIKDRVYPTLLKGLTVICREKPEDPVRFLANWLIENNPYRPRSVQPVDTEAVTPAVYNE